MWVIFLLAGMSVAVCAMIIAYIGNRVFLAIKKDQEKYNKNTKEFETNED
jgi:hypothetical protein